MQTPRAEAGNRKLRSSEAAEKLQKEKQRPGTVQRGPGSEVNELLVSTLRALMLSYSWSKHQSWLITDVDKDKSLTSRNRALVKRILFKTNTLGHADIEKNIETKKYTCLTELFIDLLDLHLPYFFNFDMIGVCERAKMFERPLR
ncbi:GL12873 [Drosophila persimilis]|uniref:GL12873 n=1 Tax=Drosophila persimilis TaxID=7234 RepID=B4GVB3_DROPE|nr:GL12873 [Drosophila persimilis]